MPIGWPVLSELPPDEVLASDVLASAVVVDSVPSADVAGVDPPLPVSGSGVAAEVVEPDVAPPVLDVDPALWVESSPQAHSATATKKSDRSCATAQGYQVLSGAPTALSARGANYGLCSTSIVDV